MSDYATFLERKAQSVAPTGRTISRDDLAPLLHEWQKDLVVWSCQVGRAALWADTGLGKTFMQCEWARQMGDRVLIVAPLAVCHQTIREAAKIGIEARYLKEDDGGGGIMVTNYERVANFGTVDAVVLDEASILKQSDGKTRSALIEQFADTPYRLACTATPAPNDVEELTNQAAFLGVSSRVNMLSAYFIHDSDGWRLKGHARYPMFRWMSTWAVAVRKPSDLGYSDEGYDLPGLEIVPHLLPVGSAPDGQLFATDLGGVGGRAKIRKETLAARVDRAVALVKAEPDEPWLLWTGLNAEADALAKALPGAVNIKGSMTAEEKAAGLLGFADGDTQILITKPSLAAFGLNWQHCARMAFVGLSDSYEAYYQSIRRCYRYGQTREVIAHIILSELESQIAANVARKERQASDVMAELVDHMNQAKDSA